MTELDEKTEALIKSFVDDLQRLLTGRLEALVLYGSAARGGYIAGLSDLNFMVIVDRVDLSVLMILGREIARFRKKKIATPLVLDHEYISRSLDTFPIEFSEILAAHRLLYGENPFAGIEVRPADLRLQCEAEVKQKLLLLRQALMQGGGRPEIEQGLLRRSFKSFMVVLRALIRLFGKEVPQDTEAVIAEIEKHFSLKLPSFHELAASPGQNIKLPKTERERFLNQYLSDAAALAQAVDGMTEEKK